MSNSSSSKLQLQIAQLPDGGYIITTPHHGDTVTVRVDGSMMRFTRSRLPDPSPERFAECDSQSYESSSSADASGTSSTSRVTNLSGLALTEPDSDL